MTAGHWLTISFTGFGCRNIDEANYLLAVINSDALQEAVRPLMSQGQFGARDLHKHLWKLSIPEFDPMQELHAAIAEAGATAAAAAGNKLEELIPSHRDAARICAAREWIPAPNFSGAGSSRE